MDGRSENSGIAIVNPVEIEVNGVADLILEIQEKYSDESICVLARTNRLLDKVYQIATDKEIKCANKEYAITELQRGLRHAGFTW